MRGAGSEDLLPERVLEREGRGDCLRALIPGGASDLAHKVIPQGKFDSVIFLDGRVFGWVEGSGANGVSLWR